MRNTDSGLDHRTAGVQPMAVSKGFYCPATQRQVLLLLVKSESTRTYNTHAALKAFQSALPLHPHAHNKPVLHPHTHSVSKIHFLTLYKYTHTSSTRRDDPDAVYEKSIRFCHLLLMQAVRYSISAHSTAVLQLRENAREWEWSYCVNYLSLVM